MKYWHVTCQEWGEGLGVDSELYETDQGTKNYDVGNRGTKNYDEGSNYKDQGPWHVMI